MINFKELGASLDANLAKAKTIMEQAIVEASKTVDEVKTKAASTGVVEKTTVFMIAQSSQTGIAVDFILEQVPSSIAIETYVGSNIHNIAVENASEDE